MNWETLKFGKWQSDTDVRGRTGDEERRGDDESEKWSKQNKEETLKATVMHSSSPQAILEMVQFRK